MEAEPKGHEQASRRPALVLSASSYNSRVGLAVCCPITSRVKGYPFEVEIPGKLNVSGAILSDQVRTLDWVTRKADFICKLPNKTTAEVFEKLVSLISG